MSENSENEERFTAKLKIKTSRFSTNFRIGYEGDFHTKAEVQSYVVRQRLDVNPYEIVPITPQIQEIMYPTKSFNRPLISDTEIDVAIRNAN